MVAKESSEPRIQESLKMERDQFRTAIKKKNDNYSVFRFFTYLGTTYKNQAFFKMVPMWGRAFFVCFWKFLRTVKIVGKTYYHFHTNRKHGF
jgi:hypothetical protein